MRLHWRCACVYWLQILYNSGTAAAAVPRVWSAHASIDFVRLRYTGVDDEYDHTRTHRWARVNVRRHADIYSSPFTITDWLKFERATQILQLLHFRVANKEKCSCDQAFRRNIGARYFSRTTAQWTVWVWRKNTDFLHNLYTNQTGSGIPWSKFNGSNEQRPNPLLLSIRKFKIFPMPTACCHLLWEYAIGCISSGTCSGATALLCQTFLNRFAVHSHHTHKEN